MSTAIKRIESEENVMESDRIVSKASSLYKNSSDASTMTYPEFTYGKDGFLKIFSKSGNKYIIKDKSVLTTELKKYSSKLYHLLQNINNGSGNVFIYTNYVNYGGTSLLKQLLLNNGFYEYSGKNVPEERYYKSFMIFDESTSLRNREQAKRIFNSDENKGGKYIRIIIGSPIISEGITLKAVRQVHILEPYWNMSKINQIVGRAVRNYSHHSLEPDQRTVEIYKYVSIYSKMLDSRDIGISNFFIDKEKYILPEEKDRSNKVIERQLKEISFDCEFNISRNTITDVGIDGSPECDYTTCNYECKVKPKSEKVDNSTYKMYLTFFDQFDIFFVLEHLKRLFQDAFIWSLDDIKKSIFDLEPLITDEAIYTTLFHIVDNKVLFLDKYDREGFIIRRGPYYIFNNFDIDINSSIYSKMLDFSIDTNKYTLQQFSKSSLGVDIISRKILEPQATAYSEELNNLSEQDLEYNKIIEQNYTIYGTFRNKKMKVDKWEHKYGNKDDVFRIVDSRNLNKTKRGDQRNDITGKAATSYNLPELKNIAIVLEINVSDTHEKRDLIELIQRTLEENNRILK